MLTVYSKRRWHHRCPCDACAALVYGPRAIHDGGKPTTRAQADYRREQSTQPQRTVRARASNRKGGPARLWNEAASLAFQVRIRHRLASKYTVCAELHVNRPLGCRRGPTMLRVWHMSTRACEFSSRQLTQPQCRGIEHHADGMDELGGHHQACGQSMRRRSPALGAARPTTKCRLPDR